MSFLRVKNRPILVTTLLFATILFGLNLSGQVVSLSSSSLNLGSVTIGSASSVQLVTIKNSGTSPLRFTTGAVPSSGFQFGGTGTCTTGVAYNPGSSCTISIKFVPTATGTVNGKLTIYDNAANSPQIVPLSGTGVTSGPAVSLSPSSINLGSVTVGSASGVQLVTIKSTGTSPLQFTTGAVPSSGFQFGGTGTCTTGVAYNPGSSCTISIKFVPTATGTVNGALTIYDNTPNSPQTVPLTGAGVSSTAVVAIGISPASATVQTGQTQQFDASVSGSNNTSVSWTVNGVLGGNSTVGTVSTTGLYAAPATVPSPATVTISATSNADTTKFARASVTITAQSGMQFYVSPTGNDSNSGSAASPWRTIQHAANNARPGATVHVAAGTYYENLNTSVSGTAAARIVFLSDTQWSAKLIGSADTVWYNTGDYVDIRGFDITSSASSTRLGINSEASHTRILNNHIHDIQAVGATSNGGAGIFTGWIPTVGYTGIDNDAIGNVIHDIGFSVAGTTVHGIYYSGPGGTIQNNIVYRCQAWGIALWHSPSNIIIANNTVFANNYGGITVGADSSSLADYVTVSNNIIYNTLRGILEWGSTGTHNQYLNNLIYGNSNSEVTLNNGLSANATVSAPPQFLNYVSTGTGDPTWYASHFQLAATSPAVDAGTSTGAPSSDIDGGSRPYNSRYDIGAYERGATPAPWPW